jgi:hypothetical protein
MEVGGQLHASVALPPGKTRYLLYRRLCRPQGRCGRVGKISPQTGFDPRTFQPVAIPTALSRPTITHLYAPNSRSCGPQIRSGVFREFTTTGDRTTIPQSGVGRIEAMSLWLCECVSERLNHSRTGKHAKAASRSLTCMVMTSYLLLQCRRSWNESVSWSQQLAGHMQIHKLSSQTGRCGLQFHMSLGVNP